MGAEETHEGSSRERVHDEQVRRRGIGAPKGVNIPMNRRYNDLDRRASKRAALPLDTGLREPL